MDKCHRQENGHVGKGGGGHRDIEFLCAFQHCLTHAPALLAQAGEIFYNDDGIIAHHADAQGQTGEGDNVEGDAGKIHHDDGSEDRKRGDDADEERITRVAQENKQHQKCQQRTPKDRLLNIGDGLFDEFRLLKQDHHRNVGVLALQQPESGPHTGADANGISPSFLTDE